MFLSGLQLPNLQDEAIVPGFIQSPSQEGRFLRAERGWNLMRGGRCSLFPLNLSPLSYWMAVTFNFLCPQAGGKWSHSKHLWLLTWQAPLGSYCASLSNVSPLVILLSRQGSEHPNTSLSCPGQERNCSPSVGLDLRQYSKHKWEFSRLGLQARQAQCNVGRGSSTCALWFPPCSFSEPP